VSLSILEIAHSLVHGERQAAYTHPSESFARTAAIFSGIISHKLKEPLTPQDAALLLIGLKISRLTANQTHRDSVVDIAGYAECLDMINDTVETKEENTQ
jgi:hypothetical protein